MSDVQIDPSNEIPAPPPNSQALSPITKSQRIDAMDILRGFALIGILLMNIEWFNRALVDLGAQDTNLTGLDHTVGWLIRCFVEGKFYPLFALLFGMGFGVMLIRAKEAGRPFAAWFSRRMIVLIIFGVLHMIFLWGGDILHSYGFAGLFLLVWVSLLKKKRFKKYDNPKSYFILSVRWLSLPIIFTVIGGMTFGILQDTDDLTKQWHEEINITKLIERMHLEKENLNKNNDTQQLIPNATSEAINQAATQKALQSPDELEILPELSEEELLEQTAQDIIEEQEQMEADIRKEITAFTQGSYWEATKHRTGFALNMFMLSIALTFFILLPIFILGYWLISSGVMRNYKQHSKAFKIMAYVGIGLGVTMETGGLLVAQHPVANQVAMLLMVGETLFFIGQYVLTVGYFGLIMRLLTHDKWFKRLSVFSPMGRMALTNYIMHSVILTSIFYGYAGGFYGEISRAPQMLIVLAIIVFQILFSRWWLTHYAFGPLEWVWRCLSYKQLQPMRIK